MQPRGLLVIDGNYIFYSIQHKLNWTTSRWGDPYSEWKKARTNPWSWCDTTWARNLFVPNDPEASREFADIHANTGYAGWKTLQFAKQVMHQLEIADDSGEHDERAPKGNGGRLMERRRHLFRIVRVFLCKKVIPVANLRRSVCGVCGDLGWLLIDNDTHGFHVEACDSCDKFDNDEAASSAAAPELLAFVSNLINSAPGSLNYSRTC